MTKQNQNNVKCLRLFIRGNKTKISTIYFSQLLAPHPRLSMSIHLPRSAPRFECDSALHTLLVPVVVLGLLPRAALVSAGPTIWSLSRAG